MKLSPPRGRPLKSSMNSRSLPWKHKETETWWAFRPRKKIFSHPPPKFPANTFPAPRPPTSTRPGDPPPSWDFQQQIVPPPLPAPRPPLSPPRAEKEKISETSKKIGDFHKSATGGFCAFSLFSGETPQIQKSTPFSLIGHFFGLVCLGGYQQLLVKCLKDPTVPKILRSQRIFQG